MEVYFHADVHSASKGNVLQLPHATKYKYRLIYDIYLKKKQMANIKLLNIRAHIGHKGKQKLKDHMITNIKYSF
jgi:hypothetical protein